MLLHNHPMSPRLRSALCVALSTAVTLTLLAQIPSELPSSPAAIDQGRKLYEVHCSACHGPKGEGGKGPTLAQPTLPRAGDDASLLRIIRAGIDGTEMPRARMER